MAAHCARTPGIARDATIGPLRCAWLMVNAAIPLDTWRLRSSADAVSPTVRIRHFVSNCPRILSRFVCFCRFLNSSVHSLSNLQNQAKRDKTHRENEHECRTAHHRGPDTLIALSPICVGLTASCHCRMPVSHAIRAWLADHTALAGAMPAPGCAARARRSRCAVSRRARLPMERAVPARRDRPAHELQRRGISRAGDRRRHHVSGAQGVATPAHHPDRRRWAQRVA